MVLHQQLRLAAKFEKKNRNNHFLDESFTRNSLVSLLFCDQLIRYMQFNKIIKSPQFLSTKKMTKIIIKKKCVESESSWFKDNMIQFTHTLTTSMR